MTIKGVITQAEYYHNKIAIMKNFSTEFKKTEILLKKADNVCILSHKSPDGDTVGCNMALRKILTSMGKTVFSVCADVIPDRYSFTGGNVEFIRDICLKQYDLIISVDVAVPRMIGFESAHKELFSFFPFINIDHHPDNTLFGNINIVDDTASATAIILYHFLQFLDVPLPRDVATDLLLGIYDDTGGFMHGNTSREAYDIAGKLLSSGADIRVITQQLFHYFPLNRLRLWGEVFKRANMNTNRVVSSFVTKRDFKRTHTTSEDMNNVVEFLNMVPNSQYAMLLTEDESGPQVKGSLRTLNENVDVSQIAHKFGGGGHKKASGFRIPGKIEEEIRWKIVGSNDEEIVGDISKM